MSNTYREYLPEDIQTRLLNGEKLELVDVREPEEWEAGHIASARHIPLGELPARLSEIDPGKETIMVCRSGNRSRMACEFLLQHGLSVVNMTGGMLKWPGEVKAGK